MSTFDKQKLSDLLTFAQGHRTREAYAKDAGLSLTYVSSLVRQLTEGPPGPASLKKLADASQGRISYAELMGACGFIIDESQDALTRQPNEKVEMLARAGSQMTDENLQKLLGMAKLLEPDAFKNIK